MITVNRGHLNASYVGAPHAGAANLGGHETGFSLSPTRLWRLESGP